MSHPTDAAEPTSAGLDVARSRANTGASLSAAPFGTSYRSTNGSSVVSNGSLLDLYARSPGSIPGSIDAPTHMSAAFPESADGSSSTSAPLSGTAAIGDHWSTAKRGFEAPSYSMPPSDSNASIWTTASAAATETQDDYKRASMAGFDAEVMRSVQAAQQPSTFNPIAEHLPRPPRIGVEAPADDSDGSFYEDEPLPEVSNHDSFDRSDNTIEAAATQVNAQERGLSHQADDAVTNVLPSPPVPRRTSSVVQDTSTISPSTSQMEDLVSLSRDSQLGSRSGPSHLSGGQIPQRRSSSEYREEPVRKHLSRDSARPQREYPEIVTAGNDSASISKGSGSPTKGTALLPVDENARQSSERVEISRQASREPSLDEQRRLEKEVLAEADDSRPRTLKEARERAKMRRQQSESVSLPSNPPTTSTTTSPQKGSSLHVRDVASSVTAVAAEDERPGSGLDLRDRPLRNPKRLSSRNDADRRSVGERSAPSDYSHDSDAEGAFTLDEMSSRLSRLEPASEMSRSTSNMDELTEAVDDAMNSLNFGDGDETLSADEEQATPMPPKKEGDRPQIEAALPSARSLASITGSTPNVLQEAIRASPMSSPAKAMPQTPKASATAASYFTPAISNQSIATPPLGSPVHPRVAQTPSTPQHSGPAPLPKRLDVYGRTIPLPKAFASNVIIRDKKLKPSWDRARTYAQFTNELLRLETNLNIWMEAVQRPAMRQQKRSTQQDDWLAQGTLPRSRHVRDEGSYADSVRSDMTFPMRGDGAKAKEIVNVLPTMEESPTRTSVNLPYPGVMAQQQQPQPRSNSMQSFSSASGSALALGSTDSLSRGSGTGSANRFFGGLSRKGSKRAQSPALASAGSASVSSLTAGAGGSRSYLRNNRSKLGSQPNISAPVISQSSTDALESSFSNNSRPESPATGAPRISGLGLGGSAAESSSSQARLGTVQEASGYNSATVKGPRAPLGPRAPNVGTSTRFSGEMKRTGSGQSQSMPITPITPITTITPTSSSAAERGFGSGATFVSRLGGGGSFTSLGGTNSSREGHISPDYLSTSCRPSDVSGTSPTSPTGGSMNLRTSLSYTSVRDRMRRGSSPGPDDEAFNEALRKLGDILPEADEATLRYYLKKAKGNDLTAIGDYLQDQSLGKSPKL